MVTATDGDGSLTSSVKELMVDVVMSLTLDDLCLVMQAASMCPFLPQKLHTALDRRQSFITWPFFPQRLHRAVVLADGLVDGGDFWWWWWLFH